MSSNDKETDSYATKNYKSRVMWRYSFRNEFKIVIQQLVVCSEVPLHLYIIYSERGIKIAPSLDASRQHLLRYSCLGTKNLTPSFFSSRKYVGGSLSLSDLQIGYKKLYN